MSHPVHPRCSCGKSMYKAFQKGKAVKKSDPWAFCRNPACSLSGPEGIADVSKARRARAVPEVEPPDDTDAPIELPDSVEAAWLEEGKLKRKRKRFKLRLKAFKRSRAAGDTWDETAARVAEVDEALAPEELVIAERFQSESANVTVLDGEPATGRKRKARVVRSDEPQAVADARSRLKPLVRLLAPEGTERTAVGLILAILNQEMGAKSAANMLIDEMKLDKLFGIEKFP